MKKVILIIFSIILVLGVAYIFYAKNQTTLVQTTQSSTPASIPLFKDGRQCYSYTHEATAKEPYTTTEFIDMTVVGNTVTGTKRGTQKGPDMYNGYTGMITGTIDKDTMTDVFSYTIEGSRNQEKEIFKTQANELGIEKLRYPLVEEKDLLVPDMTGSYKTMLYARVECDASN